MNFTLKRKDLASFQYLQLEERVRRWLVALLPAQAERLMGPASRPSLHPVLQDGTVLCALLGDALVPGSLAPPHPGGTSLSLFQQMENVSAFCEACRREPVELAPAAVFQPRDLVEAKNLPKVLLTLQSLGDALGVPLPVLPPGEMPAPSSDELQRVTAIVLAGKDEIAAIVKASRLPRDILEPAPDAKAAPSAASEGGRGGGSNSPFQATSSFDAAFGAAPVPGSPGSAEAGGPLDAFGNPGVATATPPPRQGASSGDSLGPTGSGSPAGGDPRSVSSSGTASSGAAAGEQQFGVSDVAENEQAKKVEADRETSNLKANQAVQKRKEKAARELEEFYRERKQAKQQAIQQRMASDRQQREQELALEKAAGEMAPWTRVMALLPQQKVKGTETTRTSRMRTLIVQMAQQNSPSHHS